MVEEFGKKEFEKVLAVAVRGIVGEDSSKAKLGRLGLVQGEESYAIQVNGTNKRIVLRSSIDQSGVSAETGKDSIRGWVEYFYKETWRPLTKGQTRWTTRVKGWETRTENLIRELWEIAENDSRKGRTLPVHQTETEDETDRPRSLPFSKTEETPTEETPTEETPKVKTKVIEVYQSAGREPNDQQKDAILSSVTGQVRVLAGPGSGKTFSIGERVSFLLSQGIDPDSILAVTFSRTMADELLDKLIARNPSLAESSATEQITTIHAICYRLLKEWTEKKYQVLDRDWKIKKILDSMIERLWPYSDERPGWKEVYNWICQPKFKGLATDQDLGFYTERLGDRNGRNLHQIRRDFDNEVSKEGQITFPDMLFEVDILLQRNRQFRERFQSRFEYIIIDEGQDTSGQAMRILQTLAEPQNNLFIVGDPDQLLYRFTGATPESNLYNGFSDAYPDGKMVKLETNYRSTTEIVNRANRLIANNYSNLGGPYLEEFRKTLNPRDGVQDGDPITFDWFETPEQEANWIADSILESLQNGRKPGDFFVGTRTRAQLGYIEGPLVRRKVPFVNITGGSFWTSKHAQDVVAYIRLAANNHDDKSFQRVFNIGSTWSTHPWGDNRGEYCSHRYLGRAFLSAVRSSYVGALQELGRYQARSRSTLKKSFLPGLEDLTSFMGELEAELATEGPAAGVRFVVENCYRRYIEVEEGIDLSDASENGKLDDLETIEDIASQFDRDTDKFLEHVSEMIAAAQAVKDKDWGDYVVLSTCHRLKGLERPVVFGPGLAEGQDKVSRQPRGLLPHTFSMIDPPNQGILPTGGKGRIEDERCIAFVLITRAKEEVHLSGMARYRTWSLQPSRFVRELGLLENEGEDSSPSEEVSES